MDGPLDSGALEAAVNTFALVCHARYLSLKEAKALFEQTYVELTLEKHNGQKLKTAQALGISRKRLWELLRSWNAITVAAAVILGAGTGWMTGAIATAIATALLS